MENPINPWMIWGENPLFLGFHPCRLQGSAPFLLLGTQAQSQRNSAHSMATW